MTLAAPALLVAGGEDRLVVLVGAAAHADVGQTGVLELVESGHHKPPLANSFLMMCVSYTAGERLQRVPGFVLTCPPIDAKRPLFLSATGRLSTGLRPGGASDDT